MSGRRNGRNRRNESKELRRIEWEERKEHKKKYDRKTYMEDDPLEYNYG
jgi:hypothetical protein